jgi:2-octaprenyl-6-methoxyphenol hydroxylase
MVEHADVLIVGGGPVGASLALALRDAPLTVALLEACADDSRADRDPRALALSWGSREILERLGVWGALAGATPIERIHVSQRGGFGVTRMGAAEVKLPALGYVTDYPALSRALRAGLLACGFPVLRGAALTGVQSVNGAVLAEVDFRGASHRITAKLLVLAEGGRLPGAAPFSGRAFDYGQAAVVGYVTADFPHRNTAYERFTPEGPLALLPFGEGFALVWTASPEKAEMLCSLDEGAFLGRLARQFGGRLEGLRGVRGRACFPLRLRLGRPVPLPRVALLGNAAQTLHPVTGQGFNLGLRDAWELAREIGRAVPSDVGSTGMLARYRRGRLEDAGGGVAFTDSVVRLFSNDDPVLRWGRGLGLAALELLPPVKRFLMRKMIYGARG